MSKLSTPRSSRSHSRSISPPCMDQGSLWKFILNWSTPLRHNKHKVKDHDDNSTTVVIGAGKHTGNGTYAFVNNAIQKMLYFSYRNCFTPLPNGSTTDTRWGCLIRTSQMLLAYAMTRFYYNKLLELEEIKEKEKIVISGSTNGCKGESINDELWEAAKMKSRELFMDSPSAPFSIHRLESEAYKRGVEYATWLSPTPIAHALAAAGAQFREETKIIHSEYQGSDNAVVPIIICCEGRIVDMNEVQTHLLRGEHVILLIPVYLGIGKLNDKYKRALYCFLEMHSACGAAGGQDRASLFIMGYHGERVLVFDPHIIQRAYTSAETVGRTSGKYYMISINNVDPCMLLGFYLNNANSFDVFEKQLAELNKPLLFELISITSKEDHEEELQEKKKVDNSQVSENDDVDLHDIEVTWSSTQDDSVFEEELNKEEVNTIDNLEENQHKVEAVNNNDADVTFTKEASYNPFKPRQEYKL